MSKYGLCFKIFVNHTTSIQRIAIIEDFLSSIEPFFGKMNIVGVIDNNIDPKIAHIINRYKQIKFFVLNNNYGISIATNIGIEYLLNNNCDYIFCSDDDMLIKNIEVFDIYSDSLRNNDMFHLCYYPFHTHHAHKKLYKNNIIQIAGYSGCFYVVTANCVKSYGYLPVLDNKYGHEHVLYTKHITKYQYDIINSNMFVELNTNSIEYHSNNRHLISNCPDTCVFEKPSTNNFWISKITHIDEYN